MIFFCMLKGKKPVCDETVPPLRDVLVGRM
jgi:hypothetical protein